MRWKKKYQILKMSLKLNLRQDLLIKYYLNLHLSDDNLNEESVLYEILTYTIQKINENKDKDLSYNNLKFTSKTLKYIFGDDKLEDNKSLIISSLKKLIETDYLERKGKSIHITNKSVIKFYNIEK